MFQCYKNSGSPTSVTRKKVAPNMADSTSMKNSVNSFNSPEIYIMTELKTGALAFRIKVVWLLCSFSYLKSLLYLHSAVVDS